MPDQIFVVTQTFTLEVRVSDEDVADIGDASPEDYALLMADSTPHSHWEPFDVEVRRSV